MICGAILVFMSPVACSSGLLEWAALSLCCRIVAGYSCNCSMLDVVTLSSAGSEGAKFLKESHEMHQFRATDRLSTALRDRGQMDM